MTSVLSEELLEALGQVRRETRRRVGRPWPMQALSGAQVELVRVVRREPGISVAAAARELGVAANTVSTLVGSLVATGMVRREADPADRRIARLHLTAAASRQVERWRDERITVLANVLDDLPEADRDALEHAVPALTRLAGRLREGTREGKKVKA